MNPKLLDEQASYTIGLDKTPKLIYIPNDENSYYLLTIEIGKNFTDIQFFDQILSTFRFIDQTTTATTYLPDKSWQTVNIPTLGISTCLPPKWTLGSGNYPHNANSEKAI